MAWFTYVYGCAVKVVCIFSCFSVQSKQNEGDLLISCFDGCFVGLLSRHVVVLQGGRDHWVPRSRYHPQQGADGAGSGEGKELHMFFFSCVSRKRTFSVWSCFFIGFGSGIGF